jgi:uncharacterized protein (UPF0264 family)
MFPPSPQLLVSVRSAAEAEAALEGGAQLIDVKEPRHGSLGRAGDAEITDIIARVAGMRPVSAALGELAQAEQARPYHGPGLAYVKWGLSGLGNGADWRRAWQEAVRRVSAANPACRVVLVAYADWQRAEAPSVAAVSAFAREEAGTVLLVDTFVKTARHTLLDWLPPAEICRLCASCHEAGVRVALAGSLGAAEIELLRPERPDWFAVRGAVCEGNEREATVSVRKVKELVGILKK